MAADSVQTEMMYAMMLKGKRFDKPEDEAAQMRETAEHLRGIAAAERRYIDILNAASTEGNN